MNMEKISPLAFAKCLLFRESETFIFRKEKRNGIFKRSLSRVLSKNQ